MGVASTPHAIKFKREGMIFSHSTGMLASEIPKAFRQFLVEQNVLVSDNLGVQEAH